MNKFAKRTAAALLSQVLLLSAAAYAEAPAAEAPAEETAAVELAVRMNLSHRIGSERMAPAQDAVLAHLPRGMRIVRTDDSETMEVSVHSLTGIGSALGIYGLLGLVGTLVAFCMAE